MRALSNQLFVKGQYKIKLEFLAESLMTLIAEIENFN